MPNKETKQKQVKRTQTEEYNDDIQKFFLSEAWQKYALPLIGNTLQKELPKPTEDNWEKKYMYAFALSDAFSLIINTLKNLSGKNDFQKRLQEQIDATVDQA